MKTHGMSKTPEYTAWAEIKRRCYNPKSSDYKYWGGKGITMCNEWQKDFLSFYNHIGPRPADNYSVDRIDSNRNYEPGNVKWSTKEEQSNNRVMLKNNTSGYTGVSYNSRAKKWRAKYRNKHIGYFDTFEQAIIAHKKAENE